MRAAQIQIGPGRYIDVNYTEIAAKAKVHHSTVARLFTSNQKQQRVEKARLMIRVQQALGITMDELFYALGSGRMVYRKSGKRKKK